MSVGARIEAPWGWHPDPLTMDTGDYFSLPEREQTALREWLQAIVGDEWGHTDTVKLGEGFIDVTLWVFDGPDTPRLTADRQDIVKTTERFPCRRPPPVWKPLR